METIAYQSPGEALPFKNRSAQILTVGILQIVCGCMTGCLVAMMPIALFIPQPAGQPTLPVWQIVFSIVLYGAITAALVWLGIGGVRRRRWFRPLTIILSTHWLILGIMMALSTIVMIPVMRDSFVQAAGPGMPASAYMPFVAVSVAFSLIVMIGLPLTFLLLMRPPEVQMTLEHYDPVQRWTDRVPMQILGLSLTLFVAGLLYASVSMYGALPMLGILLTGIPAIIVPLLLGGALMLGAYHVYQLRMSGWWIGVLVVIGSILASLPTAFTMHLEEYYRAMGTPEETITVMLKHATLIRGMMIGFGVLFAVSFLLYMLKMKPLLRDAANGGGDGAWPSPTAPA